MKAKVSQRRFMPCHENRRKTIPTTFYICVSFLSGFPSSGLGKTGLNHTFIVAGVCSTVVVITGSLSFEAEKVDFSFSNMIFK